MEKEIKHDGFAKDIKAKDMSCQSCGATMKYSPERQKLFCENCQSCKDIVFEMVVKKRLWEMRDKGLESTTDWANEVKNLKCPNCGAGVVLNKLEYTKNCPYCDTSLVGQEKCVDAIAPDGIIPFMFSDEDASLKYRTGIKKKFFAPNAFKKAPPVENIKGIYVPSFSFDAKTTSKYVGRLAEDSSYTDSKGRRRTSTSYQNISGTYSSELKDVIVESSSKIDQSQMTDILPFDMSKIVKFDQGFIMGYTVEQYENTAEQCKMISVKIMEQQIKSQILSQYSYDRVISFSMDTLYMDEKYMYYLLPIYKCDYKYKDKTYTTIMNGQTGKVGGGYPKSVLKILLVVLGIIALVAGIFALFMALE